MTGHTIERTAVEGLLVLRSPVHADDRGSFTEAWQREKMTALGLPDFGPVQHNVAVSRRGVTRGVHAEPWDKLVTVAVGRAHGAWVDLRPGSGHGRSVELTLDPGTAVFVPRGVGNAYQALVDDTAYVYLVNEHWRADAAYVGLHPGDPEVGLAWPVPLEEAVLSAKDRAQPSLSELTPLPARRALVLGPSGKVGRALLEVFPDAAAVGRDRLDLADPSALAAWPWHDYDVVLNAAAHTAVDAAETDEGRHGAWVANAAAPALLADLTARHGTRLVHFSTDYVYDGSRPWHVESESLAPLSVYGASKAAGDLAVGRHPRHYLLRTSWVIGDDPATPGDFVSTMRRLAHAGVSPDVVEDQVGRLTFAAELARATRHLLDTRAAYGTYHVTNGGPPTSWAALAREVFRLSGRDADDVLGVTTAEYEASRPAGHLGAPRPRDSTLDLSRLRGTGFEPEDALLALRRHLA